MKYRVKRVVGLGYFAQTYITGMFLKKWYTIGKYRFGLHPEDFIDHPEGSYGDAEVLIRKYKVSLIPKQIEYTEVN